MPAHTSRRATRTWTNTGAVLGLLCLTASGCERPGAPAIQQAAAKQAPDTAARARAILAAAKRAAGGAAIDRITRLQRVLTILPGGGRIDQRTVFPDQHRLMRCTEHHGCHVMAIAGEQAFEQRSAGARAPLSPAQLRQVRASLWRAYPLILRNAAAPGVALAVLEDGPERRVIAARPRGMPTVKLTFDDKYLLVSVEDEVLGATRYARFFPYEGVLAAVRIFARGPDGKPEQLHLSHAAFNQRGLHTAAILEGAPEVPVTTFIINREDPRPVQDPGQRAASPR